MKSSAKVRGMYDALLARYGAQRWWPAETPLEVCLGAILTQNTAWRNVEQAIANLKARGPLTPEGLWRLPAAELAELIKPAGYFRLKAGRLRNFLRVVMEEHGGALETMFEQGTESLREELLSVSGIGRETADAMLLYAAERPVFVVDAYTFRVAFRHSLIDQSADYDELQETFASALTAEVQLFKEYHALLVQVGKEHCKKAAPLCAGCPLETCLEKGEPREMF